MKVVASTLALSIALSATSTRAHAETRIDGTAPSQPDVALQKPQTSGEQAAPAPDGAASGDIIVTAQRRNENVQRVPVAVSVIGGEQLAARGTTNIGDLAALLPSVTFTSGNELRNASTRIRGVGTDVFSTGVESSISTVIDGVVLQRPGAAYSDLGDIERIEVLRGPQGTLFGKNSSAGVVNIITKSPNFSHSEADISGTIAEQNEYRLNGAVSGPLGPDVAIRVAGFYRSQGGYVLNRYNGVELNGAESYGGRVKLAIRPTSTFSLLLEGDYSHLNADCCAQPPLTETTGAIKLSTGTAVGPDNKEVNVDVSPVVRQTNYGVSATADLGLGIYTLTAIGAYRYFRNFSNNDPDNSPAQFFNNPGIEASKTKTLEVRLTSPKSDVFDFVAGFYYFNGSIEYDIDRLGLNVAAVTGVKPDGTLTPRVPGDLAELLVYTNVAAANTSAFGQGNLHIGPKLTLTGGLRYIHEVQKLYFNRPIGGFFNGHDRPVVNAAFGPFNGRYPDDAVIGKASLAYSITDTINAYVSYSTGYKSKGLPAIIAQNAVQTMADAAPPETSRLLEAGLKTQFFQRHLTLNITAFRTRFKDYQGQVFSPTFGAVVLTSVGGLKTDGVEVEFSARPLAGLTLSGGATYLNAKFQNTPNGPCFSGQTAAQGCLPNAQGVSVQSLDGKPFTNAPSWRYTLSGRYQVPDREVRPYFQADYRHQSSVLFSLDQNPNEVQGAYGVFDLSAGAQFGHGRYDVGIFVKNLFDKHYVQNVMVTNTNAGPNAYADAIPRDFDRYVGANFRAHF